MLCSNSFLVWLHKVAIEGIVEILDAKHNINSSHHTKTPRVEREYYAKPKEWPFPYSYYKFLRFSVPS